MIFDLPPSSYSFASHEEVYTPDYCLQLEAAYGQGMMSEGGAEGIEQLFVGIDMREKSALDFGCGLGGIMFYLAEQYRTKVVGLEVNSWLIAEAKRRTPEHLKGNIDFCLSRSDCAFPFPDESFDVIYSKGVLVHIESKEAIFREFHRILKKGGRVVINDCLSSEEKRWGGNIAKLVELEKLVMYPEGKKGYAQALEKCGLQVLSASENNAQYFQFNTQLVARLEDPSRQTELLRLFGAEGLADAIEGYQAILQALESGEIKLMRFVAQKQ